MTIFVNHWNHGNHEIMILKSLESRYDNFKIIRVMVIII